MFEDCFYIRSEEDYFVYIGDAGESVNISILRFTQVMDIYKKDWMGLSKIESISFKDFQKLSNGLGEYNIGDLVDKEIILKIPDMIDGYTSMPTSKFSSYSFTYKNKDNQFQYICKSKIMPSALYSKYIEASKFDFGSFKYVDNLIKKVLKDQEYRSALEVSLSEGFLKSGIII